MKSKILTVGMVVGAMLFIAGSMAGCSSCGWCSKKTEVKKCGVNCVKPCCAKKATLKKCGENCTKPCCVKAAVKKCGANCTKPCCAKAAATPHHVR